MDCKINRETLPVTETLLDEIQEQSIELDYVLPDYDPDIFRMIGCTIEPTILSWNTSSDRITYELRADIRILYCGADSPALQCVTQQLAFSRSLELPRPAEKPFVTLRPKTTYANCRAISPRRLEVRGAVSVAVHVTSTKVQEVISDLFGMQVQTRKVPVTYVAERTHAIRNCLLQEEVALGSSKPPIRAILRQEVQLSHQEHSILAGKLVVKGEAAVRLLYTAQQETPVGGVETMQFTIPYSQIIDLEPLDDTYQAQVETQAVRCDAKPILGKGGTMDALQCEVELRMQCTAVKTSSVQLVTDAFSTRYLCEQTAIPLTLDGVPEPIEAHLPCSATLAPGDIIPQCIDDLRCHVRNLNMQLLTDTNRIRVSGMLCCQLLARDSDNMPLLLEKEEAFEVYTDYSTPIEHARLQAQMEPSECTYHLSSDGTISIQVTLHLWGSLHPCAACTCLSDFSIDPENKLVRDGDYALKLYYGVEHEDIWTIAKRCHTSVTAIMEENDLDGQQLAAPGMLFIPIIH